MKLLIDSISKDLSPWVAGLKEALGDDTVITWEEMNDPADVTTAVIWNHRPELFAKLPAVKLIASLGAGVDHILKDPLIPKGAQITRVISEHLSTPMSNYCLGAVLHYKKQFDKYLEDKSLKRWDQQFEPERDIRVGILGLGVLGADLAGKLIQLGFPVSGLSQSRKSLPGVTSYVNDEMDDFLSAINLLICMLPATSSTKGILSSSLFNKMPMGSFLVNVARGHHQINADIFEALESGQLAGAFLDVFPEEPLPDESPLWTHTKVFITPHIAVVTKLAAAVPQIAVNHRRVINGEPLTGLVDREKGY